MSLNIWNTWGRGRGRDFGILTKTKGGRVGYHLPRHQTVCLLLSDSDMWLSTDCDSHVGVGHLRPSGRLGCSINFTMQHMTPCLQGQRHVWTQIDCQLNLTVSLSSVRWKLWADSTQSTTIHFAASKAIGYFRFVRILTCFRLLREVANFSSIRW